MTTLTDKMQQRIKELNEDLVSAEMRIVVLRMEKTTLRKALEQLRDCDWTISLPDRMDAVRDIARKSLEEIERGATSEKVKK